jgi:hypothetical protein
MMKLDTIKRLFLGLIITKFFFSIELHGSNTGVLINKFLLQLWLLLFADYTMTNIRNLSLSKIYG